MGAALPIAAIAMTAASSVMGGIQEGSSLRAEARSDAENGRLSLKAGEQEAMDTLRQARFEQGGAAVQMASSGLLFGGSIGTVLSDSALQAEMDIDRIRDRSPPKRTIITPMPHRSGKLPGAQCLAAFSML
ncbi:hypothetical protein [Novosphingobium sp. ST904]|uniref:hypothetical protein n=1 Tax=Novosphingobium sp. ST904 TaxID=1684385 RepID=UPI0006C87C62|nr:hypothetical protein [Novosphingobium sp. ST904]KPH59187.1 hypothetical protein ADT71_23895 [Novosphingobium sp. ST904]